MRSATSTPVGNGEHFHTSAEGDGDQAWDVAGLRTQLGSAPDGLATYDLALRCVHVSDTVARKGFGRRPDEIVGRTLCEVAAPDVARAVEPLLRHVLETEKPLVNVEISGEKPSATGASWHWLGSIYPLRDSVGNMIGVGSLGTDITAGKQADERAEPVVRERSAEQRLAFLAEDLATCYARAVDSARLHTQAERRLRELEALYRADEALHQSLRLEEVLQALVGVATDVLEADKSLVLVWDSRREQLVVGAARGFESEAVPLMVLAPGEGITGRVAEDGQPIVVHDLLTDPRIPAHLLGLARTETMRSLVSVPIKVSDEVVSVFNVIFTVPRIFSADDQRLILALARRAALAIGNARLYEQAQQAIHAREQVLAATSHELRNPLGNIKGFVTTLQRTDVDWDEATRRDFLSDIEREADRLEEFVDDLLDLSRFDDAGVHIGTRARAGLSALVTAGLDRVRHMLAGREVHVRIPDELPALEVDTARVEHVVANLVENAAKYTPADTRIGVIGRLAGDQVELAVEDEGPGIATDHLERIFDRFFRGRVADNVPGTGLGLAICRSIVQAEGGSIWAENRPSGGARFVVALPLTRRS